MAAPNVKTIPKPGEVWLSCPPYLMLARIVAVDTDSETPRVSYEPHAADGSIWLVEHAALVRGWWRTFQRLEPRFG